MIVHFVSNKTEDTTDIQVSKSDVTFTLRRAYLHVGSSMRPVRTEMWFVICGVADLVCDKHTLLANSYDDAIRHVKSVREKPTSDMIITVGERLNDLRHQNSGLGLPR